MKVNSCDQIKPNEKHDSSLNENENEINRNINVISNPSQSDNKIEHINLINNENQFNSTVRQVFINYFILFFENIFIIMP